MSIIISGTDGITPLQTNATGTAAAPAISRPDDPDTGIYFAANEVNISTGGTRQLAVLSTGEFRFNSGFGSAAAAYACRAWVNFDGTSGTPSIRGSANVSSITDEGTGDYTVNFTNAMPDNDYCICGSISNTNNAWAGTLAGATRGVGGVQQKGNVQPGTNGVQIETLLGSNAANDGQIRDFSQTCVAIFR